MTDPRTGRICASMAQWLECERRRMQESILQRQQQQRLLEIELQECKRILVELRNLFFQIFGRNADELEDDLYLADVVESEG